MKCNYFIYFQIIPLCVSFASTQLTQGITETQLTVAISSCVKKSAPLERGRIRSIPLKRQGEHLY